MIGGLRAGPPREPLSWREPAYGAKRCPKCSARLSASPVEDRCSFCGYSSYKSLTPKQRQHAIASLARQIRTQVNDDSRRPRRFVAFDPPVELATERWLLQFLFTMEVLVWVPFIRRGNQLPDEYISWFAFGVLLPGFLLLFNLFSSFATLKLFGLLIRLSSALAGGAILYGQAANVPSLLGGHAWLLTQLAGYLILGGLWSAAYLGRDLQAMRG